MSLLTENRFVRLRKAMGMTQQQFAAAASLSIASVASYEKGLEPSINTLNRLVNLALSHGLADLAFELNPEPKEITREFTAATTKIRLPQGQGTDLATSLHDSLDQILQRGDPDAIGALEQFFNELNTGTNSSAPHGEQEAARDTLRKRGGNDKWHMMLDAVLISRYQKAIRENLMSFSEAAETDRAMKELHRRIDSGEFAGRDSSLAPAADRESGTESAERKTAAIKSVAKRSKLVAEELRGTGRAHPADPVRHQPPKKGSGGTHGGRS